MKKLNNRETIQIRSKAPLNVLFVSSIPPRECGIATFTQDLIESLKKGFGNSIHCSICALENHEEIHSYSEKPAIVINTDLSESFISAAEIINHSELFDVVVIQHEFGFFNTSSDAFKDFYKSLNKPLMMVFHTVLPLPNAELWDSINEMVNASISVVVMTEHAKRILVENYQITETKIQVIAHGTHLLPHIDLRISKQKHGLENFKVLSTFGLLGCNKSIETTLLALPSILEVHPDVIFLIIGRTHPGVVKNDGESYREMLLNLVHELNLKDHVRFVNAYLPLEELLEYLKLTDVYLFTSNDPNQAVSGTLSYAAASGCPIVSTPIPHALELLGRTEDCSMEFGDYKQLAHQVVKLLSNTETRLKMTSQGLQKMANTSWPNAAIAYANLFRNLDGMRWKPEFHVPTLELDHLYRLTTKLGMVQFSKYDVPNLESGYTLDDNARALITVLQYYNIEGDDSILSYVEIYLNFIENCWQADLKFLNYKDLNNQFTQQNYNENLEDSMGRAIWALGYLISMKSTLPISFSRKAEKLLGFIIPQVHLIHSTRSMSFIIKGLYFENRAEHLDVLVLLADRLMNMYTHVKTESWHWFEDILSYANSVIPESLILAFARTNFTQYKLVATESFDFLLSIILQNGELRVVSNNGWLEKESNFTNEIGGEQPIDVAYTVIALESFYLVLGNSIYKEKLTTVFTWFLGNNHLKQAMYNSATKGCYDGLEKTSVNLNQGAESTVSYLLARLAIERLKINDKLNNEWSMSQFRDQEFQKDSNRSLAVHHIFQRKFTLDQLTMSKRTSGKLHRNLTVI